MGNELASKAKYLLRFIPDKPYLQLYYFAKFRKFINFKNPQTFNEKLQWLKLYDHRPEYPKMVDKYEAKKYVADIIGNEYIIPTYGVWDRFEDIDFDSLPDQFVLKCTHDSGGLVICRDKNKLNIEDARKKITESLNTDYYYIGREWPYKNVKPRVLAEKYMEDSVTKEPWDYKFFCFGGTVKCLKVDFDRFIEHHANYYDINGNLLKFGETNVPPDFDRKITLPENLNEMVKLAEKLSAEKPFLRADFYDVNGKVYFGELTFYPASGMGVLTSEEWDYKMGEWIVLPDVGGGYFLIRILLFSSRDVSTLKVA